MEWPGLGAHWRRVWGGNLSEFSSKNAGFYAFLLRKWFCPISPNPDRNPIANPKHTLNLKLTVNINRNGIRLNGGHPKKIYL